MQSYPEFYCNSHEARLQGQTKQFYNKYYLGEHGYGAVRGSIPAGSHMWVEHF